MFFVFCLLSRLQILNQNTVETAMKRSHHGLLLITSQNQNCLPCRRIEELFANLTKSFEGKIQFGAIYSETSSNLISALGIGILPSVVLYVKGQPIRILQISFSTENLYKFCQSLISPPITEINSLYQFYNFSSLLPSNIIIYDTKSESLLRAAMKSITDYGDETNIAILKNKTVVKQLGYSKSNRFIIINRPLENFTFKANDLTTQNIVQYANSNIQFIENQEMFGMNHNGVPTITILYDDKDPYHHYEIGRVFNHVTTTFPNKFVFQACDYLKCSGQTLALGARDIPWPMLVMSINKMGQLSFEPYQRKQFTNDDIDKWINLAAFGIQSEEDLQAEKPEDDQIPYLLGKDFQRLVLDPKFDVLIYVASPRMPYYHEAREQFKAMMQIFGLIKGVKFFEFNPTTQHVTGLQIPKSENPQISVWPAQAEPNGGTLPAIAPLQKIIENVLPILKSPVNQKTIQKMQKKMQEILQGM